MMCETKRRERQRQRDRDRERQREREREREREKGLSGGHEDTCPLRNRHEPLLGGQLAPDGRQNLADSLWILFDSFPERERD
jgi:hypothetical protein